MLGTSLYIPNPFRSTTPIRRRAEYQQIDGPQGLSLCTSILILVSVFIILLSLTIFGCGYDIAGTILLISVPTLWGFYWIFKCLGCSRYFACLGRICCCCCCCRASEPETPESSRMPSTPESLTRQYLYPGPSTIQYSPMLSTVPQTRKHPEVEPPTVACRSLPSRMHSTTEPVTLESRWMPSRMHPGTEPSTCRSLPSRTQSASEAVTLESRWMPSGMLPETEPLTVECRSFTSQMLQTTEPPTVQCRSSPSGMLPAAEPPTVQCMSLPSRMHPASGPLSPKLSTLHRGIPASAP